MFVELDENQLVEMEGGSVLGVLAAGAIVAVSGTVTACAVVAVGKVAQKFSDWIG